MSSGDSLLVLSPGNAWQPGTLFADVTTTPGVSVPAETIPIVQYDDTTQEYMDWYLVMPEHYDNTTGITCRIKFSADEAAPDVAEWLIALRRIADDAENLDTTVHTYVYQSVVATAPSVVGEVAYVELALTSAQMDGVVKNDYFILRASRDPTPASGTNVTGDCGIRKIHIKET